MSRERTLDTFDYPYPTAETRQKIRNFVGGRKVFWDLDGSAEYSLPPVLDAVKENFDVTVSAKDVHGFDSISKTVHRALLDRGEMVSYDEVNKREWEFWTDPKVLARGKPVPGAQFIMWQLKEADVEQEVVTSRIPGLRECTLKRVKESFEPYISRVHIRTEGDLRNGEEFKSDIVGPNFLVEDNLRQALAVANNGGTVFYLAYTDDWRRFQGHPNIIPFYNSHGARNTWPIWDALRNS